MKRRDFFGALASLVSLRAPATAADDQPVRNYTPMAEMVRAYKAAHPERYPTFEETIHQIDARMVARQITTIAETTFTVPPDLRGIPLRFRSLTVVPQMI